MTASERPGRTFDAVLCDLDNVIRFYDMTPLSARERAAGVPEGITAELAYAPAVDLPLLLGRATTQEWVASVTSALVARVRLAPARARELAQALADAPFRADAAVVALLRRLPEGMPLVLVTNATLDLERDLEAMGLADLADHVVSSAREGVAKPDRAIYDIAVARAGVAADRCLFVDDRRENVEAATALGMTGLHYRRPADLHGVLGPLVATG
ncbi:HAD-IA family hydrolase [Streptomyces sp. SID14478]|uniref:HAD family hydrolase n=1 Tax=Streptomyces sp. SID14478 TaxID=2706073 RepID=UPI0031BA91DB